MTATKRAATRPMRWPGLAAGFAALALAACVPAGGSERARPTMANPASVHCIERGGRLIAVRTPQGDRNDCLLPGGERIDEWALFRRDNR